jgi:zinc transport system ATP-binding protein
MTAVSIKGLWLYREDQVVLENINLEVCEGDFLGLIGPNGGGKSTLLKIILGLIVRIRARSRSWGKTRFCQKHVGYMPQKNIFDQAFPVTARDVVLMGRYSKAGLFRRYSAEDRQAAADALRSVGMEGHAGTAIGSLSGGEQQRVFVARSLVSEPSLLLLDEPTAGIDAAQQREFYDLLSRLNEKMTIIMVTHDLTAVSKHVSKVACLNQKLFCHGSKELTAEDIEQAYKCPVELIAHGFPHRVLREHD